MAICRSVVQRIGGNEARRTLPYLRSQVACREPRRLPSRSKSGSDAPPPGLGASLLSAGRPSGMPISRPLPSRVLDERVIGPGERKPVDRNEGEGPARDVDSLPERDRGEEARRLVRAEGLEELGFGQVALGVDREVDHRAKAVTGGGHSAPACEEGERPAAGRSMRAANSSAMASSAPALLRSGSFVAQ